MRFLPTRRYRIAAAVLTLALPSAWLLGGEPPRHGCGGRSSREARAVHGGRHDGGRAARAPVRAGHRAAGGQQAGVYQMKISSIVPEGTVVKQGTSSPSSTGHRRPEAQEVHPRAPEGGRAVRASDARLDAQPLHRAREHSDDGARARGKAARQGAGRLRGADREAPGGDRLREGHARAGAGQSGLRDEDRASAGQDARSRCRAVAAARLAQAVQDFMAGFTIKAPAPGMVIYTKEWNGKKRTTGSQVNAWDPGSPSSRPHPHGVGDVCQRDRRAQGGRGPARRDHTGRRSHQAPHRKVTNLANVGEQRPNADAKVFEVKVQVEQSTRPCAPA